MATDGIAQLTFRYQRLRTSIVARFDVPHASSDGGLVLLKAVDERLHLTEAVARCLTDPLLGLVCAVLVLVALVAALVVWLRAEWARIALRVAGSWIAASGFLLLGWAARKG